MTKHHHSRNTSYLRLSVAWNSQLDEDGRQACWDDLTIWCSQRGGYLGGTPLCACLVLNPTRPRFTKQLERWLAAQRGIAEFRLLRFSCNDALPLETREGKINPEPGPTPQELAALLEALGNYQQHLVESFQQCIDVLPRLSQSLRVWHSGS